MVVRVEKDLVFYNVVGTCVEDFVSLDMGHSTRTPTASSECQAAAPSTPVSSRPTGTSAGRLDLPDFAPTTKMLLESNNVEGAMKAVVKEACTHFFFKYDLRSSEAYQKIGKQLVRSTTHLVNEGHQLLQ